MGDKENMGFPCTLYYGKDLKELQPLGNVVLDNVSLQSEEEVEKWDNLCCQTLTIEVDCKSSKKMVHKLFKNKTHRLPRKIKKIVKRDYFCGYTSRICRLDLIFAYWLNNSNKTAWLKGWNIEIVKK